VVFRKNGILDKVFDGEVVVFCMVKVVFWQPLSGEAKLRHHSGLYF